MTDPYQPNPWADPTAQPQQDPYGQPSPYGPYSPPGQYPPATPPPPPFVSPDTPSYAAGSSPVPTPMPMPPEYGYPPAPAPTYGYAAGYGGYGATPYVPIAPQPKTNGMAIGAMVVSIVGLALLPCYGGGGLLGLVGAILGHVSRRQIKASKESGEGMALAGVIIGWITTALGLIIVGVVVAFILYAVNTAKTSYNNPGGTGLNELRSALAMLR